MGDCKAQNILKLQKNENRWATEENGRVKNLKPFMAISELKNIFINLITSITIADLK